MRSTLKFLIALVIAFGAMLLFRALVFTIYTIPGSQFEPTFKGGDRVMVNRWSYGLRTGGDGSLFNYGRICRQPIAKEDWIAFNDSADNVLIGRCTALPGDTVRWQQRSVIVPGLQKTCARHDHYFVDGIGFVREEQIIGRIVLIVYHHKPGQRPWQGFDNARLLLPL